MYPKIISCNKQKNYLLINVNPHTEWENDIKNNGK